MIGRHYDYKLYNCAHVVADWYRENLGVEFPTDNTFSRKFALWIRHNFTPIESPEQECLVVAEQYDGALHVGVYDRFMVTHNYKPGDAKGGVCRCPLGIIKRTSKKVVLGRYTGDRN